MEREAYIDNIKAILIILVVLGHLIEPMASKSLWLFSIYAFIYTFHIPAFVLISGYLSRHIKDFRAKEFEYLFLYIIFTFIYWFLAGGTLLHTLLNPYALLWYLLSLVFWYVLQQFLVKLSHPVLISFVLAVAVGYANNIGTGLSLSRTAVFLPFFMLGYYMNRDQFKLMDNRLALAIMLFYILVLLHLGFDFNYLPLYGDASYNQIGYPAVWYAGLYRLGYYCLATMLAACFLALVPVRPRIYTKLGSRTLYIYLFHYLFIRLLYLYIL